MVDSEAAKRLASLLEQQAARLSKAEKATRLEALDRSLAKAAALSSPDS
jgi:hypothetical protein